MDKLAFGGDTGSDDRNSEQRIQDEIAGDSILLRFTISGGASTGEPPFMEEVFKQGHTFEWVKNKVSIKLEAKYMDLTLFLGGKRIPEPFCLVDMGVKSGDTIEVKIAEGAVIGLDEVRKQVQREIEEAAE